MSESQLENHKSTIAGTVRKKFVDFLGKSIFFSIVKFSNYHELGEKLLSTEKVKQQLAPQHLNVPAIENGNLTEKRWSLLDTLINPLINPLSLLYGSGFSIFAVFFGSKRVRTRAQTSDRKIAKMSVAAIETEFREVLCLRALVFELVNIQNSNDNRISAAKARKLTRRHPRQAEILRELVEHMADRNGLRAVRAATTTRE